jgi:hypothetical protein
MTYTLRARGENAGGENQNSILALINVAVVAAQSAIAPGH